MICQSNFFLGLNVDYINIDKSVMEEKPAQELNPHQYFYH